jgi:hypothetical protein
MATVKVYKYETTDAKLGQPVQSKRMGTVRYIASVHGWKSRDQRWKWTFQRSMPTARRKLVLAVDRFIAARRLRPNLIP